jgi:periplasmic protein TonB
MRPPVNSGPEPGPSATTHEPLAFSGATLEEMSVWTGLCGSIRDALFPSRLAPLELTSTPIPVPDRLAVRTNRWAVGTSTIMNVGALAMVLFMGVRAVIHPVPTPAPSHNLNLSDFTLFMPRAGHTSGGGGGGGSNDLLDPVTGKLPRFEKTPITPPQVPLLDQPKLAIDPAIAVQPEIKLPDNPSMPNIGVHASTMVSLASNGPGTQAGIGAGEDGGVGPGRGIGLGPGFDRGFGGSIYRPGIGGVSNPIAIVSPEAEFSDEARRAKYQGICMVSIIVDSNGYPQNPRILRSLGMGLDEKALDAVRGYRFKPAMKDGKPVPVMITVEVNFRLY